MKCQKKYNGYAEIVDFAQQTRKQPIAQCVAKHG